MNKVLIYLNEANLDNTGGPLGYNYNLNEGLKLIKDSNVYYIKNKLQSNQIKNKFKKINNKFIRSFFKGIRDVFRYIRLYIPFKHTAVVDLKDYDVVHFHDTFDIYNCRKSLKKYKGIVVLTTHSPILPSIEVYKGVETWVKFMFFYIFAFQKKIDKYAFRRANYIISPCEDAMNSYPKYLKSYYKYTNGKFKYLLTGCLKKNISKDKQNEIIHNYNIDKNKFNICYLGRHNKLKGYDILCRYGEKILNENSEINFIVGGRIGPLYPPKISNWKELGFTKDALEIMSCCDVYVSCNKDTYFDLATIQALSVGIPVITKRVGGNLFFEKEKIPGVYLFDTYEEFSSHVSKLKMMNEEETNCLKNKIFDSYSKLFSCEVFAEKYIDLITKIN